MPRATTTTPGGAAQARRRSRGGATSARRRTDFGVWAAIKGLLNSPLADYYLLAASAVLLVVFGLTMVTSASSVYAYINTGDAWYYAKRQIVFAALGGALAWWISRRALPALRMLGFGAMIISAFLLIATLAMGTTVNGNKSWLTFGSALAIQPSEFAKLAIIVWGADVLGKRSKSLDQPARVLFPFTAYAGLLILLVVFQHDMGTAVVMAGILIAMLWVVGFPIRILGGVGSLAVLGGIGLVASSGNRQHRIAQFFHGEDATAQSMQSLYGIAAGGWFGRGLGKARQKWGYLPEAHTDFVFAILGEELGLFGTLTVVALFCVLGFAGLRCAMRSDMLFCRMAAAGCTAWLVIQALMNLFVVVHLLPVTGVPLPFVSYGGSALLANLMAVGVLLACARQEPQARALLARRPGARAPRLTTVVDGGRA